MSLSIEEAIVEGITDVIHSFDRETATRGLDPDVLMEGVLEVLNDYVHFGVPVITTQVILNEGDWVTVKTYGDYTK